MLSALVLSCIFFFNVVNSMAVVHIRQRRSWKSENLSEVSDNFYKLDT